MFNLNNSFKSLSGLLALSLFTVFSVSCGPGSPLGGSDFNFQGLMVTKILPDKITVSSSLKWSPINGADHYELSRIQDNGAETGIGASKIPNSTVNFSDPNLQESSTYKYVIRAIDSNNKQITKSETLSIKPITSTDLKSAEIQDFLPPPAVNTITRETTLKWSSVPGTDLYYPSIINDASSKQIFGIFTKDSSVNINVTTSPFDPSELVKQEFPVLTGGLEKSVKHRFSVYTIRFDNPDPTKVTAVGLRQSKEVYLIL